MHKSEDQIKTCLYHETEAYALLYTVNIVIKMTCGDN